MDWVYNVPIKFFEYDLIDLKNRLTSFEEKKVLLIASKRVINNLDLNMDKLANFNTLMKV